jgi:histidine ammonia-lyase
VVLGSGPLDLVSFNSAYDRRICLTIEDAVWRRVDASHARVEAMLRSPSPIYGVNTGFGALCTTRIAPGELDLLQENLILSHAVGVGPPAPAAIVRLLLLLKIQGLGLGASGVRRELIATLQQMLNADVLPVIPTQGSLGASGDLAPLAHLVLPLLGRGEVTCDGRVEPATVAFERRGLRPIKLAPKEGLALINGTQFMSAYAAALWVRARRLLKHADLIAAMSLEGLQGSLRPFDERLHRLRPHRGAVETAENVRRVMVDSEILVSHANCGKVQDPYSLRCVPQVHGASRDAVRHLGEVVQVEINSVTDNPLIMEDGTAVSGGNFHGQPLALALDYLAIALAELASISERRIYLLLSGHDGLPPLLMADSGVNSGFMMPQYTAAALVSENKVLAHPASVDSIPTSLGQEDHVSMGATAATKAWQIMGNAETVLAIEQMCAAQALDVRAPTQPGRGVAIAHQEVRKVIAHADRDRLFGEDIQKSLEQLRSQTVAKAVEAELGALN